MPVSLDKPQNIGFIGAGKMATALAKGLSVAGCTTPAQIVASDVLPNACEQFRQATGGQISSSNAEVISRSDIVFLAVKPQTMGQVLAEAKSLLEPRHLVISIAAGVTLDALAKAL